MAFRYFILDLDMRLIQLRIAFDIPVKKESILLLSCSLNYNQFNREVISIDRHINVANSLAYMLKL